MKLTKNCLFFWEHEWTKWEQYKERFCQLYPWRKEPIGFVEDWQKRQCLKCGKEQRQEI